MRQEQDIEKLLEESNVNKNSDCCDEPKIDIVDLSFGWSSDANAFTMDVICENCWTTMNLKIHAVKSEIQNLEL